MTVFWLLTYSCVVATSLDGDLLSKTCRWSEGVSLYRAEDRCKAKGESLIGTKVHSFIAENRTIEKFKCVPVAVQ